MRVTFQRHFGTLSTTRVTIQRLLVLSAYQELQFGANLVLSEQ